MVHQEEDGEARTGLVVETEQSVDELHDGGAKEGHAAGHDGNGDAASDEGSVQHSEDEHDESQRLDPEQEAFYQAKYQQSLTEEDGYDMPSYFRNHGGAKFVKPESAIVDFNELDLEATNEKIDDIFDDLHLAEAQQRKDEPARRADNAKEPKPSVAAKKDKEKQDPVPKHLRRMAERYRDSNLAAMFHKGKKDKFEKSLRQMFVKSAEAEKAAAETANAKEAGGFARIDNAVKDKFKNIVAALGKKTRSRALMKDDVVFCEEFAFILDVKNKIDNKSNSLKGEDIKEEENKLVEEGHFEAYIHIKRIALTNIQQYLNRPTFDTNQNANKDDKEKVEYHRFPLFSIPNCKEDLFIERYGGPM